MKEKIKSIIFDFDDTVHDTSYGVLKILPALDKYGKKIGIPNLGDMIDEMDFHFVKKARLHKDVSYFNRMTWIKEANKKYNLKLNQKQMKQIFHEYWKVILHNPKPHPDAKFVLSELKKKYKLYLMSDSDGTLAVKRKKVANSGLRKYFNGVVYGDMVKTTKPDKRYYSYLAKKHNVDLNSCIMVGDKPPYDLEPAKKLGMKTIWIKKGRWSKRNNGKVFNYVDYKINNLKELLKIL